MDLSSPSLKLNACIFVHNDPLLKIDDSKITVVNEYKFLSIIFDKKLSFIPHIKYPKNKSTRAQQLLRVVAHTE